MLLGTGTLVHAQRVNLSGKVTDRFSDERVIGAVVMFGNGTKGTYTNAYGHFSLSIPINEPFSLKISMLGYHPLDTMVTIGSDAIMDFNLEPKQLETITVSEERPVQKRSSSRVRITSPDRLNLPSLKPEVDILNLIQLQTGVQSGLEGSVGFSVRGGNNDQNLLIMDNIPLYNTGHFAGFVSIFDPFAINTVDFYKGGFPAKYGGKISSVVDIYLREGDMQEYHGEVVLGTFSGKIAMEGPIIKGKSSFLISFRRSTIDAFLKGLYLFQKPEDKFLYRYHDINVKINHKINPKDHLYLSYYSGGDRMETSGDQVYFGADDHFKEYTSLYDNDWGNRFLSFRWNRTFSKGLFLNTTVAYSNFHYDLTSRDRMVDNGQLEFFNDTYYGVSVRDMLVKSELDYVLNSSWKFNTGINFTNHFFVPVDWFQNQLNSGGIGNAKDSNKVTLGANEASWYAQAEYSNGKVEISPGVRISTYLLSGENDYFLFEPRLKVRFNINENVDIEANYSRMNQTVHSLNTSGTSLTPDIWIPVTNDIRPSSSDQVALSYGFGQDGLNIVMGGYYKTMNSLIDYNRVKGFGLTKGNWEDAIAKDGKGYAYGLELSAEKSFEKSFIELNYTYSRSFRKFDEINNGEYYPYSFDRPHNLNLGYQFKLGKQSTINFQWAYQTGQPLTIGDQYFKAINNHRFYLNNDLSGQENYYLPNPDFSVYEKVILIQKQNNQRMPDYHRLDISYSHNKRWVNGWQRTVGGSIYNVYNRQNAYYIYSDVTDKGMVLKKLTLFPILPSLFYKIKF